MAGNCGGTAQPTAFARVTFCERCATSTPPKRLVEHKGFGMRTSLASIAAGAGLACVAAVAMFWNLGGSTLFDWDEARHAENALEMLRSGDWIVTRYGGQPDLWNLKPPLGVWLIASGFEMFGPTELGLRFWAALFGVGTIVLTYALGCTLRGPLAGAIAGFIVLTMPSFVGAHGCRTGDHDSALTFFVALSVVAFHRVWDREDGRWLPVLGGALGLAVMTKGIVGLVPLPLFALCYLGSGQRLDSVVRPRPVLLTAGVFALIVAPWVILRAQRGSDFFTEMAHADLWKRFTEPIEGHVGDGWYYVRRIHENLGAPMFWLFLAALAGSVLMVRRDRPSRLVVCWVGVYLGLFSMAVAKLAWYILPAYPAVGLLPAVQLDRARERLGIPSWLYGAVFAGLLALHAPEAIDRIRTSQVNPHAVAIKALAPAISQMKVIHLTERECPQSLFFYLSTSSRGLRLHRTIQEALQAMEPGDGILTTWPDIEQRLLRQNGLQFVEKSGPASLFRKS